MGKMKQADRFAKEMSVLLPRVVRLFLARLSFMIKKSGDITMPQIAVLHLLKDVKRCKMSQIARFLNVTTSAATGTVDRMVKLGLLRRGHEAGDRRIIIIRMTARGHKVVNAIFRERRKMMKDMFRYMSSRERKVYLGMVKRMHDMLMRKK